MHAYFKLFVTDGKVEQCRSTHFTRLVRSFIKKHDLFNPFLNTTAPNQVSFRAGSDCAGIPALPRTFLWSRRVRAVRSLLTASTRSGRTSRASAGRG